MRADAGKVTDLLEMLDVPLPCSVQDRGRSGYRHLGVPVCGALDPTGLQQANVLLGNPPDAAALEMRLAGPRMRVLHACSLALAGDLQLEWLPLGETTPHTLTGWRSLQLAAGDCLRIVRIDSGVAYLALPGGIAVPPVLGSCATDRRGGFGGLAGRLLQAGDRLQGVPAMEPLLEYGAPCKPDLAGPIRVLAGPQQHHFTPEALAVLCDSHWTVSREADRMGLRLEGPRLKHQPALGADIVSDGVTAGCIQVPASGQPILLLADGQTVGGYAKIGCVIQADLPRLAHALPGRQLRFAWVDLAAADEARHLQKKWLDASAASLRPVRPADGIDLVALYAGNLVSGAIAATPDD